VACEHPLTKETMENGNGGAVANGSGPAVSDASASTLGTAFEGRVGGFPAAHFVEDAFDSQDFVAKARRTMPLDDLLAELQAHLLKLRESLVDTINQDYTAFVGMASNLKGLDEALCRVRSPLEHLRAEIDELRTAAAQAVKQLEGKLSERESILTAHRRLELLLDAEQGLQRMEALLVREVAAASAEASHHGEGASAAERAAEALRASEVLERVAHEAARLKGQVWRLDEGAAGKQELLGRLAQLEQQLLKRTSSIFGAAIAYREEEETSCRGGSEAQTLLAGRELLIQSCWRVYLVSGKLDECQTVMRQEAVRPFIAAAVTVKALEAGVYIMMSAALSIMACVSVVVQGMPMFPPPPVFFA
jgi:conserved oligomeric Golgi complex subunit 2